MDLQFEPTCGELDLLQIGINTISKGGYVPKIKRLKHTIKERVCITYNNLNHHLANISGVLILEIVYAAFL